MVKKALGIDIGDDFITAVVTRLKGRQGEVISAHSISRGYEESLEDQLSQLVENLQWEKEEVFCGIPLSMLSVRNHFLPFQEKKKIIQALPLELDDQVIHSIDDQVFDYSLVSVDGTGSSLLTFTLLKEDMLRILASLQAQHVDPDVVMPRIFALANAVGRRHSTGLCLLLWIDISSLSLVLLSEGVCVFCRRIAYPEEMHVQSPFRFDDGSIDIIDQNRAEQCFKQVSASIRQSLDFLHFKGRPVGNVERILVTGPMSGNETICHMLHKYLAARVEAIDVASLFDVELQFAQNVTFQGNIFQTALCLSLAGLQKQPLLNLRQANFSKKLALFSSKKHMVASGLIGALVLILGTGYLAIDNYRLQQKDTAQEEQMQAIYKQTFPAAKVMRESYGPMKSAMKRFQQGATSGPVFSDEKRNLELLADISSRISDELELQVARMVIDQEQIMIRGETTTYNSVDAIKNALSESDRYTGVQIISATADKKTKKIRFEIQLQLGDA
ncbi:type II secretion system protein GspL [Desulfogranum japonicum]|uniref:type II secretion system protein GspL n=1 Tax=Desulfogranum japonicum TaxID=231447 RepID=UPI0003F6678B|nr:type II secretion system protein GspL [Desulfogranum japonicum]